MATTTKAKPTVTKVSKPKPKNSGVTVKKTVVSKPAKTETKTTTTKASASKTTAKPTVTVVSKPKPKAAAKPESKAETKTAKATKVSKPVKLDVEKKTTFKGTIYHVSKRENNGREWKVFIEKSAKPIKIFDTQAEALKFAQDLTKNKADGSYVVLHGLDGKIRKF